MHTTRRRKVYCEHPLRVTLVVEFTRLSLPEVQISHCLLLHPRGTKRQILTTSYGGWNDVLAVGHR